MIDSLAVPQTIKLIFDESKRRPRRSTTINPHFRKPALVFPITQKEKSAIGVSIPSLLGLVIAILICSFA